MKMAMHLSLNQKDLLQYTVNQLNQSFPDPQPVSTGEMQSSFHQTLDKLEHCFNRVQNVYFSKDGNTYFNHLHSDQYAMYLCLLSQTLHRNEESPSVCDKLFYLNKMMHGLDCFYTVELPSIFMFMHPIGTILGKADYSDYFFVSQNCTVGDNFDGNYPKFGKGVALYSGASVIGACDVGDNCVLGANAFLYKSQVPANSLVYGQFPENKILENNHNVIDKHFQ